VGRINRQNWWLGLLVLSVAYWIFANIIGLIVGGRIVAGLNPGNPQFLGQAIGALVAPLVVLTAVFLWPTLAICAKRWHDREKSGWWTLIMLIPVVGLIWIAVELGFLRGTEGPNQYGADPLAG
jgi:uncharacterized membrane protein YhaH (DUF805 family)